MEKGNLYRLDDLRYILGIVNDESKLYEKIDDLEQAGKLKSFYVLRKLAELTYSERIPREKLCEKLNSLKTEKKLYALDEFYEVLEEEQKN